jgi:hypothetical protein
VKALDTSVLGRFFIDDPDDPRVALQGPAATAASSRPALGMVTVIPEWAMARSYALLRAGILRIRRGLLGIGPRRVPAP